MPPLPRALLPPISAGEPLTVTTRPLRASTVPPTVTAVVFRYAPSAGWVIDTCGTELLRTTVIVAVDALPAASTACAVTVLLPACNDTGADHAAAAPPACGTSVAAAPLTTTRARCGSLATPLTVRLAPGTTVPSAGLVIASVGGCVSRTTVTDDCDTLPAWSVATAVSTVLPSLSGTCGARNCPPVTLAAMPFTATLARCASDAVPVTSTATAASTVPAAGAPIATAGGVVSRTTTNAVEALLPAASTAVNVRLLVPSASATGPPLKLVPPTSVAACPATVTDTALSTVPLTVTCVAAVIVPLAGDSVWNTGGPACAASGRQPPPCPRLASASKDTSAPAAAAASPLAPACPPHSRAPLRSSCLCCRSFMARPG